MKICFRNYLTFSVDAAPPPGKVSPHHLLHTLLLCVCVYVYVIGSIAGPKQRPTSKPDATLPTAAAVSCRTAAIQIHPIMHLLFVFYIQMIYSLDMI